MSSTRCGQLVASPFLIEIFVSKREIKCLRWQQRCDFWTDWELRETRRESGPSAVGSTMRVQMSLPAENSGLFQECYRAGCTRVHRTLDGTVVEEEGGVGGSDDGDDAGELN